MKFNQLMEEASKVLTIKYEELNKIKLSALRVFCVETNSGERLINLLDKNGLPKLIVCGLGIDDRVVKGLNVFAPTKKHPLIEQDKIIFSWYELDSTPDIFKDNTITKNYEFAFCGS